MRQDFGSIISGAFPGYDYEGPTVLLQKAKGSGSRTEGARRLAATKAVRTKAASQSSLLQLRGDP